MQRFLRDALNIIKAGTDISGNVSRALFWYRNEPLSVFGYKTAEQLVSEGRTEDVLRYVASLKAGAAAHGGRANRPRVAALYMALDTETAIKEYQQVSMLLPPGTLSR